MEIRICCENDIAEVGRFYDKAVLHLCHTLATNPDVQGKGIGKQMVEFCIRYAKENGYKAIRLDVVPENIPSRRLYEKCGFHYIGDVDLEREIEEIPIFSMYELVFE